MINYVIKIIIQSIKWLYVLVNNNLHDLQFIYIFFQFLWFMHILK